MKPLVLSLFILFSSASAVAQEEPAPEPDLKWRVYGFLRLKAQVVQDDPNVAFVGRNDGFVLQNARVGVEGTWKRIIFFRLSADGAVDERTGVNATTGTLRVELKDAFVDARATPQFGVRVGRFEIMYGLDEIFPYTQRAFVDATLEERGVVATEGYETRGLDPGRSIGVALRADDALVSGDFHLGYEVAAQNGNGEFESQNDNDDVAVSASVFARFGESFAYLTGRHKTRVVGDLPLRQDEEDWTGAAGVLVRVGPVAAAAQVMGRHTEFPSTGGPAENAYGGHVQLAYRIPIGTSWVLEPAYRYAIYDPSDLIDVDLVQEHTLGVNVILPKTPFRFQLDFTHTVEQAGRALDNDRFAWLFEVSL